MGPITDVLCFPHNRLEQYFSDFLREALDFTYLMFLNIPRLSVWTKLFMVPVLQSRLSS